MHTYFYSLCFFIYKGPKNFWHLFLHFAADHFQRYTVSIRLPILFLVFCFIKCIYRCHAAFSSLLMLKLSKICKGLTCNWIALYPSSVTYLIIDLQLDVRLTCMHNWGPNSKCGQEFIHWKSVLIGQCSFGTWEAIIPTQH